MVEMFIHSKCCTKHWELVIEDGEFKLRCERCGKPSGLKFESKPPGGAKCDTCGKADCNPTEH